MKGTVYVNNGKWYYMVRFPGELKRKARPLCAPGHDRAMSADRPRELAVQAAWRMWEAHAKPPASTSVRVPTVEEVCAAYCEHAKTYYRREDGTPTSEVDSIPLSLRALRDMFGDVPVTALTHADMVRVRDAIVSWGTCSRTTVNFYMARTMRMWKWALDAGLINVTVKTELTQVQPLKPNRTTLREPGRVLSVPDDDIKAVCRVSPPNFADMVRVHRLTGMRPEEVCAMTWEEIDRSSTPWVYLPSWHKNKWRRREVRAVLIGPKARRILSRWKGEGFVFSPLKIIEAGFRGGRGQNASIPTKRGIANWTTETYCTALKAYCRRSGVAIWTPNRVRHSFATDVRRRFGIAIAGCLLGHSSGMRVTEGYSHESAVDEIVRTGRAAIEEIG